MKKKAIFVLKIVAVATFVVSMYQVYVQYTICAPVYARLQAMSPEVTIERLNLEEVYFNNLCN